LLRLLLPLVPRVCGSFQATFQELNHCSVPTTHQ